MNTNAHQMGLQHQVVLQLSIGLDQILSLVDQLGPAERLLVSRRLDQT